MRDNKIPRSETALDGKTVNGSEQQTSSADFNNNIGCGKMFCSICNEECIEFNAYCWTHGRSPHYICGENRLCPTCKEKKDNSPKKLEEVDEQEINQTRNWNASNFPSSSRDAFSDDILKEVLDGYEFTLYKGNVPEINLTKEEISYILSKAISLTAQKMQKESFEKATREAIINHSLGEEHAKLIMQGEIDEKVKKLKLDINNIDLREKKYQKSKDFKKVVLSIFNEIFGGKE